MKDKDDWIEWHGGECPVPAGTLIDVRFRDGDVLERVMSDGWRWSAEGLKADIVAYRISKPAEPPAPDTSAEENRLWRRYSEVAMGLTGVGNPQNLAGWSAEFADAMLSEARKRGRV